MESYVVGGAVRDELMGLHPKDVDHAVVGATPEEMVKAGFKQVGDHFPVFLHPETNEEYALARTERKSGHGYSGFVVDAAPHVTLEEDLGRRDLTINSMAKAQDGSIIDPFNGQEDLKNKVLRHTTEAFREDPLRLLRVARFLARLGDDWRVAPETQAMLQQMVLDGEIDYLVPERVWKEFEKGLGEQYPLQMMKFLHELGVFDRPPFADYTFHPENPNLPTLAALAKSGGASIATRFALALPRTWTRDEALSSKLPSAVREITQLAQQFVEVHKDHHYEDGSAETRMKFIDSLDARRQKERFSEVLFVVRQLLPESAKALERDMLKLASVVPTDVIQDCKDSKVIAQLIRAARLEALN